MLVKLIGMLFPPKTPKLVIPFSFCDDRERRDIVVRTPHKGVANELQRFAASTSEEGGLYYVRIELATPQMVTAIIRTFPKVSITGANSWNHARSA
jgi:hypothetical protein